MIWLLSLEVSVAVSEGVGREPLGVAGSTVIVSPSLCDDVVAMRTVFGLLPGMVGSAVRLLADGVEPKESITCRRGMAVLEKRSRMRIRNACFDASMQVLCGAITC